MYDSNNRFLFIWYSHIQHVTLERESFIFPKKNWFNLIYSDDDRNEQMWQNYGKKKNEKKRQNIVHNKRRKRRRKTEMNKRRSEHEWILLWMLRLMKQPINVHVRELNLITLVCSDLLSSSSSFIWKPFHYCLLLNQLFLEINSLFRWDSYRYTRNPFQNRSWKITLRVFFLFYHIFVRPSKHHSYITLNNILFD